MENDMTSTTTKETDENLIGAAPDLLAACKAQFDAIDMLLATLVSLDQTFRPTKSPAWPAVIQACDAIAKAEGRR